MLVAQSQMEYFRKFCFCKSSLLLLNIVLATFHNSHIILKSINKDKFSCALMHFLKIKYIINFGYNLSNIFKKVLY